MGKQVKVDEGEKRERKYIKEGKAEEGRVGWGGKGRLGWGGKGGREVRSDHVPWQE